MLLSCLSCNIHILIRWQLEISWDNDFRSLLLWWKESLTFEIAYLTLTAWLGIWGNLYLCYSVPLMVYCIPSPCVLLLHFWNTNDVPPLRFCPLLFELYNLVWNGCTHCRNWADGWYLRKDSRLWLLRRMTGGRRYENLKNRHGNVFIFFQQSFLCFMLLMMSLGLLTQNIFGRGQGIRPGLIRKLSKISAFYTLMTVY